MQSINQNMKVSQLCDKNSTRVKSSEISETFAKTSPSHSAAVHILHNENNRFIDARIQIILQEQSEVEMMKNVKRFLR